jgi:hypothetical protein
MLFDMVQHDLQALTPLTSTSSASACISPNLLPRVNALTLAKVVISWGSSPVGTVETVGGGGEDTATAGGGDLTALGGEGDLTALGGDGGCDALGGGEETLGGGDLTPDM